MSDKGAATALGGNGLLTAGVVIAVVVAVGAYFGWRDTTGPTDQDLSSLVAPQDVVETAQPVPAPQPEPAPEAQSEQVTPAPEVVEEAAPEAEVAEAEPEQPTPEVAPAIVPSVDEIRVDAGGVAVIAGRASPGSEIEVLLDGAVVARAQADAAGAFATVGILPSSDAARVLTLRASQDGVVTASAADVILAPVPAPAPVVVEATPSPEADQGDAPLETAALGVSEPSEPLETSETDTSADRSAEQDTATSEETLDVVPQGQPAADAPDAPVADPEQPQTQVVQAPATPDVTSTSETAVEAVDNTTSEAAGEAEQIALADMTAPATVTEDAATQDPVAQPANPSPEPTPGPTEDAIEAPAPTVAEEPKIEAPTQPEKAPQIAVLQSNSDGVSLLQTAPAPPSSILLDTIGYSDSGVVQLAGRASTEAVEVRVYLDNRAVISLPVDTQGNWRGDIPNVDEGVYTLRVDAVNETGAVTSRIETPFKREAPAVLAAATQGQTGVVKAITVQTGDTLWAIARDRYGEGVLYVRVFEANRGSIRNPDLIYPGQVFDLPDD